MAPRKDCDIPKLHMGPSEMSSSFPTAPRAVKCRARPADSPGTPQHPQYGDHPLGPFSGRRCLALSVGENLAVKTVGPSLESWLYPAKPALPQAASVDDEQASFSHCFSLPCLVTTTVTQLIPFSLPVNMWRTTGAF